MSVDICSSSRCFKTVLQPSTSGDYSYMSVTLTVYKIYQNVIKYFFFPQCKYATNRIGEKKIRKVKNYIKHV